MYISWKENTKWSTVADFVTNQMFDIYLGLKLKCGNISV